jgi:hypothetical protein
MSGFCVIFLAQERQQLLDAAAESKLGVINNYEGWRVSQSGKRFKIKGVTLFNIVDFTGMCQFF